MSHEALSGHTCNLPSFCEWHLLLWWTVLWHCSMHVCGLVRYRQIGHFAASPLFMRKGKERKGGPSFYSH